MSDLTQQDSWHRRIIEHKAALMAVLSTVLVSIGGLVEIVPMFTVEQPAMASEHGDMAPYTPLEVAGRDIYVKEGCYNCHSQMVRPFRAETKRYGTWSRAYEYQYDRPFQLGSRRIGPDLHRLGGKYPDAWHWEHMIDPRSTSPGSIMPPYTWLADKTVDPDDVAASLSALQTLGHPYTDADISGTAESLSNQAGEIVKNLSNAGITAAPESELIALIAYLQRLGDDRPKEEL